MTWIKSSAKYLCIIVFLISLAPLSSSAQTLNRNLSEQVKMQKRSDSEAASKRLISALAANNRAALQEFIPTKEVYQNMLGVYNFRTEQEREAAQKRLDAQYDQRIAALWKNIEEIQAQVSAGATVGEYHFRLKNERTIFGGRSTVLIQFKDNTSRKLRINSFYETNGKWYLLNNLRWID